MSDNLKTLKERIQTDIDPAGAPGSILAQNHQEILFDVLNKVGKHTGFGFTANKVVATFPNGTMSWESNAMNTVVNFDIKVSKLTSDLNNFGHILDLLSAGDLLKFKDFAGRTVLLEYVSHLADVDGSANDIFVITVKGKPENINYTYQDAEILTCVFEAINAGGEDSSSISIQTEITANTTFVGVRKGLKKLYPVNGVGMLEMTIDKGTHVPGDVINFKRRGESVKIKRGTDVRLEGARNIDNEFIIENKGNFGAVVFDYLDGSILVGSVIGDITRGYTGAPTTTSYGQLIEGSVNEPVTVNGSGFDADMVDPIIVGNATLISWDYINQNQIILYLTETGIAGDNITVIYDNGDVFEDTDAITIALPYDTADLRHYYPLSINSDDAVAVPINGTDASMSYVGGYAEFDGVASNIDFGDDDSFSYGDGVTDADLSITFTAKFNSFPTCKIINKWSVVAVEYQIQINGGELYFTVRDDSSAGTISKKFDISGLSTGTDYHFSITKQGTTIVIKLDDVVQVLTDVSGLSYTAMENTTTTFRIGALGGVASQFLDGSLRRVGLWNVALSLAQTSAVFTEEITNNSDLI